MEGSKKVHEAVDITIGIFRTDYSIVIKALQEQIEMIQKMPKGKERKFLQAEYDEYVILVENHIGFKKDVMLQLGITDEPNSYIMPEAELAKIYDKLKDIPSDMGEDNMPHAR